MTDKDIILAICGLVFLVLQFFMHNNSRKITDQFMSVVKDFRSYLDKQNEIVNAKLDVLQKSVSITETAVTSLCDFHNKFDNNARPMWFIPQRFLELQEQTAASVAQQREALSHISQSLRELLERKAG